MSIGQPNARHPSVKTAERVMVTERSGRVDPIPARLLELGSSLLRHLLASQIRCHPITPRARGGCVRLGSSPCGVFGQGRCQMRADNPIIIGLALVAMAFSAIAILRWGRLPIRATTPSGSGVDGRWQSRPAGSLRAPGPVCSAGILCGVIVAGFLGRFVMRVLAATSGDGAQGPSPMPKRSWARSPSPGPAHRRADLGEAHRKTPGRSVGAEGLEPPTSSL